MRGKELKAGLACLVILLALSAFWLWRKGQPKMIRLGIYAGSSWSVPNSRSNRVLEHAIQRFEKSHPNVKISYETGIPKENYSNWLADRVVKGEQPDIFMVPEEDFSLLANSHALLPLDDLLEHSSKDFYGAALAAGTYQGHSYALPFESNPVMMCVNKDLLEKNGIPVPQAGWTLDDFYRLSQQLTKDTNGDGVLDQYGSTDYTWQEALVAYGGSLLKNGHLMLDSPEMRRSRTFVSRLTQLNQKYQVNSKDFDEGKVAFYPMTLAQYRTYKPYPYHISKYSSFSWTCIPMPSDKAGSNATQVSTSLFAISSRANHLAEVKEFLKLLCLDEKTQGELFEKSQGMSVLPSVMKSPATSNLLKADDFGADSLTAERLDAMMTGAVSSIQAGLSSQELEQINYLINESLTYPTSDTSLSEIQKKIEEEPGTK
ncbi:extracellular solute-binding protein [Streptococcus massiliensis]